MEVTLDGESWGWEQNLHFVAVLVSSSAIEYLLLMAPHWLLSLPKLMNRCPVCWICLRALRLH